MRLAAIFSDHMVLQRDKDNYIFGESKKNERITVSIDDIKVSRDVKAGSFCFTIPAHKAGGPYDMTVESTELDIPVLSESDGNKNNDRGERTEKNKKDEETKNTEISGKDAKTEKNNKAVRVIRDVLYGEVWLDNGQSNIELELQNAEGGKEELKNADFPEIRYFKAIKAPVIDDEVLRKEEGLCWHKVTDEDFAEFSGIGYYYAVYMHEHLGVPVGMVDCYQGGTSISCWLKRDILEEMPEGRIYLDEFAEATRGQTENDYIKALNDYNALVDRHLALAEQAKREDPGITQEELDEIAGCYPWPPPMGLKSAYRPGGLIETMLERLAPYTVKGIIYYQGEEDALKNFNHYEKTHENTMYENLLVRLIKEYRRLFLDSKLSVCVLQLPMFIERNKEDVRDWAYLRQAQERAVERIGQPSVILASLIDAGEYDNVHPVDKKTPGIRAAKEVLSEIYDRKDLGASDMKLVGAWRDGNDVVLHFDRTYGRVVIGENELKDLRGEGIGADGNELSGHIYGFEVSPDGKSFSVPDCIVEGDRIRLKNAGETKNIRYGFFNYGKVNVYNEKGMPLRPFSIGVNESEGTVLIDSSESEGTVLIDSSIRNEDELRPLSQQFSDSEPKRTVSSGSQFSADESKRTVPADSKTKKNHPRRLTIGFLVSGIMDEFTELMARGIMNAMANDESVRFVAVPVKYIDRDLTGLADKYEYQYKTMSKFLTKQNVDALIVAKDCIGCLTNTENITRFMESLGDIPMILIASKMDGYPGVTFDNRYGIEEGLNYLINKLGVKKLCMLGGDSNNSDSMERKSIFIEVLKNHGIEFQDSMYVESVLTSEVREEAGRLLDQNPEAEAVFCVNDEVAFALYEELRSRGLEPGRDVKVMGFDNSVNSAMVVPSLSTVDANAEELGRYAYHMVQRLLKGEELGEETIPTRFIRRDSMGVIADDLEDQEGTILNRENLPRFFRELFYRNGKNYDEELEKAYLLFMGDLIDYVTAKKHDGRMLVKIENEFEKFLSHRALFLTDMDALILYIEKLQGAIMSAYGDCADMTMVYETTDHVYKRLLKHLGNETVRHEERMYDMLYSMKTLVKDSLNFTYGNDRSYSTALGTLKMLDIKNAYFYVYERPVVHLENDEFEEPQTLRLKSVMNNGRVADVPYNRQVVLLDHLFDNSYIKAKNYQMVLMPLYFGDTLYGVILNDLNDSIFMNGEFLANQFGTTARMIDILKMNNEIQKQLEENLAVMSQSNIELDKLSKNDVLTGILNRRGFYQEAEEMLRQCWQSQRAVIVSYVDMNNLKIINDRFGHDDGDFALKTTSALLTEIIGSEGVVARIGGDEYAFAYIGELSEEELSESIKSRFASFNEESDKEYNVTVSCGFFYVSPEDDISLEDVMQMADQDLYIAKQNKDNRILKE